MTLNSFSKRQVITCLALGLCGVIAFSGCSAQKPPQKPDGLPDLVPCEITVRLDGKGISGAGVRLKSLDATQTWTVAGTTNESGVAKIATYAEFLGAPAGEYIVLVTKVEVPIAPEGVSDQERDRIEHLPVKVIIAPKFESPATSPLRLTVPVGGKVVEAFDVTAP
ncbi:MAG: hypothetical protein ACRC46_05995 [Thermoguttaceae bacterium]